MAIRCNNKSHGGSSSKEVSDTASRSLPNQNDMTKLTVANGDTIQIKLTNNTASTGTSWYYSVSEDWIISMTEQYGYPNKSGASAENATNVNTFLVKGLKKGTVSIRFYLVPTGQTNTQPLQEEFYSVEVTE